MNKIANGDENSRLPQVAERYVSSAGLSADSVKKIISLSGTISFTFSVSLMDSLIL